MENFLPTPEKRQRAGALQDARAFSNRFGQREASWTAVVLYRSDRDNLFSLGIPKS